MHKMIGISVIIPSFNRASFLRNNLESLINQTFPKKKYEIIVVDNMSTDNSKEVFDAFKHRALAYGLDARFITEKQKGLVPTRHTGSRAAHAPLLAFIDDDCLCSEGWLDAVVKAFRDFNADAVGGKVVVQWNKKPPDWVKKYEAYTGTLDLGHEPRLIESNEHIVGGNFSIRRDRLFECGGFNPGQVGEYLVGDSEIGLVRKMQDRGWKIVWAPDALVWHCQTVAKNATKEDLCRRYYNNGIVSAYQHFNRKNPAILNLALIIIWDIMLMTQIKAYLRIVRSILKNKIGKKVEMIDWRRPKFEKVRLKARIRYNWGLIFDNRLREFATKKDWINE